METSGKPTIYIQTGTGKVLHRQDEYDGPGPLSGAIRRAKSYDASKDADLRKEPVVKPLTPVVPAPVPVPVVPDPAKPTDTPVSPAPNIAVPPWLAVIFAIVAFMFGTRKRA